jgi:hypothetical protein
VPPAELPILVCPVSKEMSEEESMRLARLILRAAQISMLMRSDPEGDKVH